MACGTNLRHFEDQGATDYEKRIDVQQIVVHPLYDAWTNRHAWAFVFLQQIILIPSGTTSPC